MFKTVLRVCVHVHVLVSLVFASVLVSSQENRAKGETARCCVMVLCLCMRVMTFQFMYYLFYHLINGLVAARGAFSSVCRLQCSFESNFALHATIGGGRIWS